MREEREPSIEDLRSILLEEGCGLRPARKGGIRLETEWFEVPRTKQRKIPVIHNYGSVIPVILLSVGDLEGNN